MKRFWAWLKEALREDYIVVYYMPWTKEKTYLTEDEKGVKYYGRVRSMAKRFPSRGAAERSRPANGNTAVETV